MKLPTATPDQIQSLNAEIYYTEVCNTIRGSALGKAQGPDEFSSEFNKILVDQVSIPLAQYKSILNTGTLCPETKNVFIKVLPKSGKDPLCPGSYQPISLIDQDLKILSKIPADRLSTFHPELIGPSQVGFTKGRSAISNICKVLAVLNRVKNSPSPTEQPILLTLNAENAFDNVKWPWLGPGIG